MKRKNILLSILVIIIMCVITLLLAAQEQVINEVGTEKKDDSTVELTAEQVNYDKENDLMIFIGNVVILQEDTTLTAGMASFNVDTKIGQISENVKLVKEDITITGEKLEAFLNDKKYIFEEQVELLQQREDSKGEEDNITWQCQRLEIQTDTKDMTATGEVVISKKDYTITAQKAIYSDAEDKITLIDGVKIEELANDRKISGEQAIFHIGNDKLEVTGSVRSSMVLD